MSNIVTWKDLRRMADDVLANTKPEDTFPRMLDDIVRAWGRDLDVLMDCRRQLAEATEALERVKP